MASNLHVAGYALIVAAVAQVSPAAAQSRERATTFALERQELETALIEVGERTGREIIIAADAAAGKQSPRLRGTFTADDAIRRLLSGSGLVADFRADVVLIRAAAPLSSESESGPDLIVTGSSIRGATPAGSPSKVIDRAAIERSGYATTQQLLQSIPQAFGGGPNESTFGVSAVNGSELGQWQGASINLRGLGAGSTLTLINSHRVPLGGYGAFSDLSLIPSSAIERVEILTDGASAIYGADAVAGVVNLRLRDTFKGFETRLRVGTADGDANDVQASQLIGAGWSGGRALLAYEFYRRNSLPASARAFATEDLTRFGGGDYRTGYGLPGTITAGGETFAIPTGQDGTRLTPEQLARGQRNRGDALANTDLLPRQERHAIYASLQQDVTDQLDVFAELLFSRRYFQSRPRLDMRSPVTVPVTNPFYVDPLGTGEPVSLDYDFSRDLGPLRRRGRSEILSTTVGTRYRTGDWELQSYGVYGRERDVDRLTNYINRFRFAQVIADPDPATSLNLFGDGTYTNPRAALDPIRGSLAFTARYTFWSLTTKADGSLFALPGGDVRLAIGGEVRRETVSSQLVEDITSAAPRPSPYLEFPKARSIVAGYGELFVPIVGADNSTTLINRLDLSLALRAERYNDVGSTTNPKLGLTWEPLPGLRTRASYGTSFRAPPFINVVQTPNSRFFIPIPLPDPSAASGESNVLVLIGNDPAIRPERARTWTLGADLRPTGLPGVTASVTYFQIAYRDRIVDPSGSLTTFLLDRATYAPLLDEAPTAAAVATIYAEPRFDNPYGIAAGDIQIIADARVQNLSTVTQRGLDFDVGYVREGKIGRAEIGIDGTYIFGIRQKITDTAGETDLVGTTGNPVDLRLRGRASWSRGPLSASLFYNYVNGYRNTLIEARPRIASFSTGDVQLAFASAANDGPWSGLSVALNATNIFDAAPPFVEYFTGSKAIGYDPENASALGRSVSLQITKKW